MSEKTKTKAVLLIVLVLVLGIVVGFEISQFAPMLAVPSSHQAIIDSMEIIDTNANFKLTPKLVASGNIEWGKGLSTLAIFNTGKEYPQSTWIWQRYGDTEIAMTIWGPDESGKMCSIEISRLGSDPFAVKINGVTKLTIEAATKEPEIGYYHLEVQV